jgi:phospholipid/cholesterol/gamma-HCH transport system substrate-binding protein
MQRSMIDIWVGIFVILGFVAMLVLAFKVGNLGGERNENTYDVEARFDNIGNLKPRGPVKASGVRVGRVKEIHFDAQTYQAVVTLSLNQRYPFPRDTSASINTSGLLGEVYVGLEAGGDSVNLKAGDRVKITQSAIVIEKLIGQFLFQRAQEAPATSTPAPATAAPAAPAK